MADLAGVSIVIPVYNGASFLRDAIDSVLAQTYAPVELIVVDDGSTDETPRILDGYGTAFTRLSQPNRGQSAALNHGWQVSSGAVLGYLSADDRLQPRAVANIVAALRKHPEAVLAYPDFDLIDERSIRLRRVRTVDYSQRRLIARVHCPAGPGILFRRSAWQAAGGWDPRLAQIPDYEFMARLSLLGPFARVPECLAEFRVHHGSTTYRPCSPERAEEPLLAVDWLFARPDLPAAIAAWRQEALANALTLAAFRHARSRRYRQAMRCLVQSLKHDPRAAISLKTASFIKDILRVHLTREPSEALYDYSKELAG